VVFAATVIYGSAIFFIAMEHRSNTRKDASAIADAYAMQSGNMAKAALESDMAVCQSLGNATLTLVNIQSEQMYAIIDDFLHNLIWNKPEYLSVWISVELSNIDPNWKKPYGRIRRGVVYKNGKSEIFMDSVDIDGDNLQGAYYKLKTGEVNEMITEPYTYTYTTKDISDTYLEATFATRIVDNGVFIGVAGIDFSLNRFQDITQRFKPYDNSFAMLVSNSGTIIAHNKPEYQNTNLLDIYTQIPSELEILDKIALGKTFSVITQINSENHYFTFAPIIVSNVTTPWALVVAVPEYIILDKANKSIKYSIFAGIIGLFIITIVIIFLIRRITIPLQQTTTILKQLDAGHFDKAKKMRYLAKDEIGQMAQSVNSLIDTLNQTTTFAKNIGMGDLSSEYFSKQLDNQLVNALNEMRKNLQEAKDSETKRINESERLTWSQSGLAQTGEMLRQNTENINDFSFNLVSFLVKYLNATQGGVFITETGNNETILDLKAAYAFDRKKQLTSKIKLGESLVGRCAMERHTIFIDEVPSGYLYINSGLGAEKPACILLVPLVFEDTVHGVIEIASFTMLEKYQINFMENVAERIASTISNLKKNMATNDLLVKFKQQSEELALRESEMINNYSELVSAQEDAKKRELESAGLLQAVASNNIVVQYDADGTIISIKDPNLAAMGFEESDIIGRHITDFSEEAKTDSSWFINFWGKLRMGKTQIRTFEKNEFVYKETYHPIFDKHGNLQKIINIGIDITLQLQLESEVKHLKDQIRFLELQNE